MGLGSSVVVSSGVGFRHGLDPALLWLWRRLAAIAPIRPLAWEPPYAAGVALEKTKKKKINKPLGRLTEKERRYKLSESEIKEDTSLEIS